MPRVNYREVEHRFGHIDGVIVSAESRLAEDGLLCCATVTVRYQPWFEEPQAQAAREGGGWVVVGPDSAPSRVVTIEAISPVSFEVRNGGSAIDTFFARAHPVLWRFEDWGQIVCNSDVDRRELFEGVLQVIGSPVSAADVARYLDPYSSRKPPYSLGHFPFSLFGPVMAQLDRLGVSVHVAREPREREPLVALFADDVVIVARDFDVLWPDGDPIAG